MAIREKPKYTSMTGADMASKNLLYCVNLAFLPLSNEVKIYQDCLWSFVQRENVENAWKNYDYTIGLLNCQLVRPFRLFVTCISALLLTNDFEMDSNEDFVQLCS